MNSSRPPLSLIVLLFLIQSTQAQNTSECCSYSSLKIRDEYETIFPRLAVKKKGITEVTVYTSLSDSAQQSGTRHKEMKFRFDQKGQVIARIHYTPNGQPHSMYEFERNGSGKVFRFTFSYLDSTEQKLTEPSSPEITDYFYNLKDKLIKTKKRNAKGQVMPDIMSDFTKYEYDNSGRTTKITSQYYYGENGSATSSRIIIYTYKDIAGESQTFVDGKLFLTTKTQYTKGWKPLTEKGYHDKTTDISFESKYEYDQTGKLMRYETQAATVVNECPDKGTYTDVYSYNGEGLVSIISHSYEDKKCEMVFEYKLPPTQL
jgi:hypothetical protein